MEGTLSKMTVKEHRAERGEKIGADRMVWPSRKLLVMAGLFYLGLIALGIFAQITRSDLIVSGDAAATVERIAASGGMLTVAFIADVLSEVCLILLGITCYVMFRRTDGRTALTMLFFVVISGSFALFNLVHVFDAIQLVGGSIPLSPGDMNAVLGHLTMYNDGTIYAQVLGWGPWLIPLGCLGHQSQYFPNIVSGLLVVGGFGLTLQGIQLILLPGLGDPLALFAIVSVLAEFSTCGWFLYKGFKRAGLEEEGKIDMAV